MSEISTKDWENNEKKRKKVSEAFRFSHKERREKNPEKYYETQKESAKNGAAAVKEKWKNDTEWAKEEKKKMSKRTSGKNNPMYGKKIEGEHKEKLSKATSRKRWMYNDNETVYIDINLVEEQPLQYVGISAVSPNVAL